MNKDKTNPQNNIKQSNQTILDKQIDYCLNILHCKTYYVF